MKNNLLKSVAAAATASALLFSTVTSFAATAKTVTTYNTDGTVGVTSTIGGATKGKMITYLASRGENGAVNTSTDIKYIGQQTVPESGKVTFSYKISGDDVAAKKTIATVRYGSDDATTATELKATDLTNVVKYDNLTIKTYGCTATPNVATVGNGNFVEINVVEEQGYKLDEVWVNGVAESDITPRTYRVEYADNMEFIAICSAKTDNVATASVVGVMPYKVDADKVTGIVCGKYLATDVTGITFGVRAYKNNNEEYKMDNMTDNFYAASADVDGADSSYYAVELKSDEYDTLKLVPAYKTAEGQLVQFEDNSTN